MKEIGSEFWTVNINDEDNGLDFLKIGKDYKLLMSGRSAIDYVLDNFSDAKKIVYMPDYLCESMAEPFRRKGYKIYYYNVDLINNKYNIDTNIDCSIFFAMSYFGYNESNMDRHIELFNKRNIIVLEDITHRLLSDINHSNYSTFLIASLRKWFPIVSGGVAISMQKKFSKKLLSYDKNDEYVKIKKRAMNLKRDYMENKNNKKDLYLKLFDKSNRMISNCYRKGIDDESERMLKSMNIEQIKQSRVNNCLLIEKSLKNNKHIKLLYKYKNGDCPLFVPIVINGRDGVRKELTKRGIYLPVHWPNDLKRKNKLYDYELSLVCDQRYNEIDIEKYVIVLSNLIRSSIK